MKRIISITVKSFLAGMYLYMISTQVNAGNSIGTILGLSIVVALFFNIYLREELHATKRHLKDTRHFAQKYWDNYDIYE